MNTLKKWIGIGVVALAAAGMVRADVIVGGPKGGRLLDTEPHQAEFTVTPERKVRIAFYDAELKPVARGEQVVAVTAEPPGGRVKVELAPTKDGFVSAEPLPEGAPYRVVVQVRADAEARPKNFRVNLDLAHCGGCDRAEYACTCGH